MTPLTASSRLALLLLVIKTASPFIYPTAFLAQQQQKTTSLYDGYGVAQTYSWNEDAVELEIRVKVPANTRAKDIQFRAKPLSVDLRLRLSGDDDATTMLLDGNRTMRGRVAMDGTFWNIEDMDDSDERQIVVTVEKNIRSTRDEYEVVDYDWGGVYLDDEEEIVNKTYIEPEEMNIREYAASMGVDIDNINMSLVDKTMFNSGLNMTKNTMDQLSKSGYVQEVTQQADGSEYTIDPETGDSVPFSPYGDGVSQEEAKAANSPQIPFLDTDSPWKKPTPPAYDIEEMLKNIDGQPSKSNGNSAAGSEGSFSKDQAPPQSEASVEEDDIPESSPLSDPIDRLTVNRLKEILREQGLKVGGNKANLQQRLRDHVKSQLET